eukprot:760348-Hanusia_phi.AAC.13
MGVVVAEGVGYCDGRASPSTTGIQEIVASEQGGAKLGQGCCREDCCGHGEEQLRRDRKLLRDRYNEEEEERHQGSREQQSWQVSHSRRDGELVQPRGARKGERISLPTRIPLSIRQDGVQDVPTQREPGDG